MDCVSCKEEPGLDGAGGPSAVYCCLEDRPGRPLLLVANWKKMVLEDEKLSLVFTLSSGDAPLTGTAVSHVTGITAVLPSTVSVPR